MRKISLLGGVLVFTVVLVSCKTTKHKCDAYGFYDDVEFDINKAHQQDQKKFNTVYVLKEN